MAQTLSGFGKTIRDLREKKKIGLRKFAEAVGMSATYLSKVERGDLRPPGEEKVKAIARALGENEDELLALAGRVSSDLPDIILKHPKEMATFLRSAKRFSAAEIRQLTEEAAKRKQSRGSE